MSEVNCIKLMRNQKGLSVTKIAETLNINWRTAKKYADSDRIPVSKVRVKTGMMYDERWGELVSDWLEEDLRLKKKLRRTNKQIYQELLKHHFPGSYRTVCQFIFDWRATQEGIKDKGFERLNHPIGEAQVDFGLMEAVHEGEIVDIHALIMLFLFSNVAYATPLPSENQECFLSGLKQLFEQASGVPISFY